MRKGKAARGFSLHYPYFLHKNCLMLSLILFLNSQGRGGGKLLGKLIQAFKLNWRMFELGGELRRIVNIISKWKEIKRRPFGL